MYTNFSLAKRFWAAAVLVLALAIAVGTPNLLRSRMSANEAKQFAAASFVAQAAETDHTIIQTGFMSMIVQSPTEISDKIRHITDQMGGYVINAEDSEAGQDSVASVAISIPVKKFEEARTQIRKLGLKVDIERLETKDVTKEYVDKSARLLNLRRQELQYREILKQAKTIKDTLEVSDKLNAVQAQIEQQQAQFNVLSNQVDTVALTIALRSTGEAQVFGLNWRPLYQLKVAVRDGLEAIGIYAGVIVLALSYLPAAILWFATVLFVAVAASRLFVWARKALFSQVTKAV